MATREITLDNLQETLDGNEIVLLDFWAAWCGPCRMFGPIFEDAAQRHSGVVFGKVDTEAQRDLAAAFRITSIPTLMAFRERVLVFAQPGMLSATQLDKLIEAIKSLDMGEVWAQLPAPGASQRAPASEERTVGAGTGRSGREPQGAAK